MSLGFALAGMAALATTGPVCAARSGAVALPLVELYTSEGCSSCPPADRWLRQQRQRHDATWLAFHVDYWDELGWPDRYAAPAYAQRQRLRVRQAGGEAVVYTPQVMVGDAIRTAWNDAAGFDDVLRSARGPARAALALRVARAGTAWHGVLGSAAVQGVEPAGVSVWVAGYEDDRRSTVRAGENAGRKLHHDRVVRALLGPWPLGAAPSTHAFSLPAGAAPGGLVAFAQDARGRTWQSLDLALDACAGPAAPR
jgi:hypothetical protein